MDLPGVDDATNFNDVLVCGGKGGCKRERIKKGRKRRGGRRKENGDRGRGERKAEGGRGD
jgi:hypothetical protein